MQTLRDHIFNLPSFQDWYDLYENPLDAKLSFFAYLHQQVDDAFILMNMFWPDFVETDKGLFRVDHTADQPDMLIPNQLLTYADFEADDYVNQNRVKYDVVLYLTQRIAEMWQAKLDIAFGVGKYEAKVFEDANDGPLINVVVKSTGEWA